MAYGVGGYKRTSIETADRRKIIILLYEGAIAKLNRAEACMRTGLRDEQAVLINKTLDIIWFLSNALDFQKGGEIAIRLDSLYGYMRDTLTMANIENAPDKVAEVVGLLNTLLEGWRGILEQPAAAEAAEAAAPHAAPADASETPNPGFPAWPGAEVPPPAPKANGYGHAFFRPAAPSNQSRTSLTA